MAAAVMAIDFWAWLLNLDGGPSTALRHDNQHIINRAPVRNYIFKRAPLSSSK